MHAEKLWYIYFFVMWLCFVYICLYMCIEYIPPNCNFDTIQKLINHAPPVNPVVKLESTTRWRVLSRLLESWLQVDSSSLCNCHKRRLIHPWSLSILNFERVFKQGMKFTLEQSDYLLNFTTNSKSSLTADDQSLVFWSLNTEIYFLV